MKLFGIVFLILAWVHPVFGEDYVKLTIVNPKSVYRPADSVQLHAQCSPGATEDLMLMSPNSSGGFPGLDRGKCPSAKFTVKLSDSEVGDQNFSVMMRRKEKLYGDLLTITTKADTPILGVYLKDPRWSGKDECPFMMVKNPTASPDKQDTRFDVYAKYSEKVVAPLCGKPDLSISTSDARYTVKKTPQHCLLVTSTPGTVKIKVSYAGISKEWVCKVSDLSGS